MAARIAGFAGPVVQTPIPWLDAPLVEPKRGYRFGPENLLAYDLIREACAEQTTAPHARIVDLGAGCGVLGLLAAAAATHAGRTTRLTLVERNAELAAFCRHNAQAVPSAQVTVREGDLRRIDFGSPDGRTPARADAADWVIANPPFFADGAGQPSSNPMVHGATHALHGGLRAFVATAERIMAPRGTLCLVYPAQALADVLLALAEVQLHARVVHVVFARHTGAPYRVWVQATRTAGPLQTVRLSTVTAR